MNIFEQQASNRRMTAVIVAVFVGFFLFLGLGFDYFYLNFSPSARPSVELNDSGFYEARRPSGSSRIPFGTIVALLLGGGIAANSMFNGKSMVLRSTMARRVQAASSDKERQFLNVVEEMATAAGLPVPEAYIVPDPDLNAFATGMSHDSSVIAVTEGLLASLNREELQAVVAHEMSHIRNYDMRLMTVMAALLGAIALLSDFAGRSMRYGGRNTSYSGSRGGGRKGGGGPLALLIFAVWVLAIILAPLLSRMLAMAVSRQREFLADASASELTRNPLALVSALEKIRAAVMPTAAVDNGIAHLCITDPRGSLIEEKLGFTADLLATHPPMEKRILALKVMAYQAANPQTA
jgi:heat shock protein HtpX